MNCSKDNVHVVKLDVKGAIVSNEGQEQDRGGW